MFRANGMPLPKAEAVLQSDVFTSKEIHGLIKTFADQDAAMHQFLRGQGYSKKYKISRLVTPEKADIFFAKYLKSEHDKTYKIQLGKTRKNPNRHQLILREGDLSGWKKMQILTDCLEKAFSCRDIISSGSAFNKSLEIKTFVEQVEGFMKDAGLGEKTGCLLKNLAMPANSIDPKFKNLEMLENVYKTRFEESRVETRSSQKPAGP